MAIKDYCHQGLKKVFYWRLFHVLVIFLSHSRIKTCDAWQFIWESGTAVQGCHEHYGRLIGTPGKISVTLQLNYRHNTTTLHTIIIRIHVTPRLNYRSYARIRLTGVIRIWITFTAWRKARPTDAILQNVETKSAKTGKDHYDHDHHHNKDQLHDHQDGNPAHLANVPVGAEAVRICSQGVTVASGQVLDRHWHVIVIVIVTGISLPLSLSLTSSTLPSS